MVTTILRKSGGSVTLTIPPVMLVMLGVTAGDEMGMVIEGHSLVATPPRRAKGKRPAKAAKPVGVNQL